MDDRLGRRLGRERHSGRRHETASAGARVHLGCTARHSARHKRGRHACKRRDQGLPLLLVADRGRAPRGDRRGSGRGIGGGVGNLGSRGGASRYLPAGGARRRRRESPGRGDLRAAGHGHEHRSRASDQPHGATHRRHRQARLDAVAQPGRNRVHRDLRRCARARRTASGRLHDAEESSHRYRPRSDPRVSLCRGRLRRAGSLDAREQLVGDRRRRAAAGDRTRERAGDR